MEDLPHPIVFRKSKIVFNPSNYQPINLIPS